MASLRTKFTLLVGAVCAGGLALLMAVETWNVAATAKAAALARQEGSLRVAAMALALARPEIAVDWRADGSVARIAWTAPPAFADHALIDRIGAATSETATLFVRDPADGEFWRRSTNIVKPDGARAIGTPLGKTGAVHAVVARGETFRGEANILGRDFYTIYAPVFGASGAVEGVLYVGVARAGVDAAVATAVTRMLAEAAVVLALTALFAWLVLGRALGAVATLRGALDRLTAGDVAAAIPLRDRRDELGALAGGVESLRESLASAQRQRDDAAEDREQTLAALARDVGGVVQSAVAGDFSTRVAGRFDEPRLAALADGVNRICATTHDFFAEMSRVAGAMADGSLREQVEGAHSGQFDALAQDMNRSIQQLNALIQRIQSAADVSGGAVAKIETGAQELSGRAETQAANLEETAATMEQMAQTVRGNAAALAQADRLAAEIGAKTAGGAERVAQAVEAVNRIKASSDKITDIISMIESIAFQTNLLALNAGVEAARAGEAGRGFAVVASEVRALAQRAADAARDITGLIQTSAGHVTEGIAMVRHTGESLDDIRDAMGKLTGMLAEVSTAGREQATGVDEVNASVVQMDRITQENAALTERFVAETAALAAEIAGLREAAAAFRVERRATPRHPAAARAAA